MYLVRGIYAKCVSVFLENGVGEGWILKAHLLDIRTKLGMTSFH